jgi:hypothetical protein
VYPHQTNDPAAAHEILQQAMMMIFSPSTSTAVLLLLLLLEVVSSFCDELPVSSLVVVARRDMTESLVNKESEEMEPV